MELEMWPRVWNAKDLLGLVAQRADQEISAPLRTDLFEKNWFRAMIRP